VIGFLKEHGLENDFKLNLEVNHATLAQHTFQHEVNNKGHSLHLSTYIVYTMILDNLRYCSLVLIFLVSNIPKNTSL